ncbi:Endo-1,4-beta-xylanase, GH35 family [Paenibacillus sp. UNCCL117]|uniref:S-layer homology domain-containing protein n=1 Tax=unclassified Paenibacillus TaxID=185978 RepID=UPI00088F2015|nr:MULTISPECIES: S-layer homology domain-containing protein [unclassified Paenibacillus]SDD50428.1 Endo-1,4-beta-xylanase, GH35 family [Paenibacillus sp. cl123]SFW49727.1 Endo-1,4-beta-xylanase, GH35 family [Paenibacillus sp. UNCCL117]
MALLAFAVSLAICLPALAGPVNRLSTPPEGWQRTTPKANTFTIKGSSKEFILLNVTEDVYSKYFVLAKNNYGTRAFDPDNTTKFDVEDPNNIGYWLNHDLIDPAAAGTNKLPEELVPHINNEHVWQTEACRSNSICPSDYTTTAGVALLSQSEYVAFAPKLGVVDAMSGWGWWLRTARGLGTTAPTKMLGVRIASDTGITHETDASYTGVHVRPAFYLKADFFSSVKLEVASMGSSVKQAILANYTKEQLTGGPDPLYTEDEWRQLELDGTVEVRHDRPGAIFDPQSIVFNVYFDLKLDQAKTYSIDYEATGTSSLSGSVAAAVQPNLPQEVPIQLTGLLNGLYTLKVQLKDGARTVFSQTLPFSVMPYYQDQPGDSHTMFGVSTHYALEGRQGPTDTDILKKAGVKVIRDEMQWHKVEKAKGVFDFTRHDTWINELAAQDFRIIGILSYNNPLYNGKSGVSQGEKYAPATQEEMDAFLTYVTKTVEHYKGKVDTFEIWNEPNITGFWKPTPDAVAYSDLVKAASLAIRAANPDATIIAGAVANQNGYQFLTQMFEQGVYPYIDAISFHPYVYPYNPDMEYHSKLGAYAATLKPFGGWKDLYVTEVGWPTSLDTRGINESLQASYLMKHFMISAAAGLKLSSIYDLRDDGTDAHYTEDNFGIIRHDFSAKPSMIALRYLNGTLGSAQFLGETELGAGLKGYMWRKQADPVLVVWSTTGGQMLSLGNEQITASDLFGNPLPVNTPAQVSVGADPVYIKGLSANWVNQKLYEQAADRYEAWLTAWGSRLAQSGAITSAIASLRQKAELLAAAPAAAPAYTEMAAWMDSHYLQGEAILGVMQANSGNRAEFMEMLYQYHQIGIVLEKLLAAAGDIPGGAPDLASGAAIASAKALIEARLAADSGDSLPFAEEVLRHARYGSGRAVEQAAQGHTAEALAWDKTAGKLAGWSSALAAFEPAEATRLLLTATPSSLTMFEGGTASLKAVVTNTRSVPFAGKLRVINRATDAVLEERELRIEAGASHSEELILRSTDSGFAGASAVTLALLEQDKPVRTQLVPIVNKSKVELSLSSVAETVSDLTSIRFKLKNVFTDALSGALEISPPAGWELETSKSFTLAPGEEKELSLAVKRTRQKPFHAYVFGAKVKDDSGRTLLHHKLPLSFTVINRTPEAGTGAIDPAAFTGDLSAWKGAFPIYINPSAETRPDQEGEAGGASAKAALQWDDDYLYALIQVYDDVQWNTKTGGNIWNGDSVQISIDALHDKTTAYNADDYEIGFALTGSGEQVYAWQTAAGQQIGDRPSSWLRVVRNEAEKTTSYAIRIPQTELKPLRIAEGGEFGLNIAVNDADTLDRERYYEFTGGTASSKNPSKYANWRFAAHTWAVLPPQHGSSDEEPSSGSASSGPVAGGGAVPDAAKITPDQLEQDSSGLAKLTLAPGISQIRLTTETLKLLTAKPLQVNGEHVLLRIPAEVLADLAAAGGNQAEMSLTIVPVPERDLPEAVKLAGEETGGSLKLAGEVMSLELAAVSPDGKTHTLSRLPAPVEASFFYDATTPDTDLLGLYDLNESGEWNYAGGVPDSATKSVRAPLQHFRTYAVMSYDKTFADVPDSHWAFSVIRALTARHILQGTTDTAFSPEQEITRGQFAALITRLYGLASPGKRPPFEDVPQSDSLADAIAAAYGAGIIEGRTDRLFAPGELVTREEMAVMIMRAYRLQREDAPSAANLANFTDSGSVSAWALNDAAAAVDAGLLSGDDQARLNPKQPATRAESAQVIWRLMKNALKK